MLSDLKPYPAYKDSGVPWLGTLPAHWDVRRLKYLIRERDSRSVEGAEQLLRVSQYTGVTERRRVDGGDEPDTRAATLVGYKRVEPNELVVNIMLAWNGSLGVSLFTGITSPAYCVYRFGPAAQPWYFHHLLRSPSYKARVKAVSTGVVESRLRLYTDDLYRLEAMLPPVDEQQAIVRFLDHADRKIRKYIRAKQNLRKLLEEQKQAIIHQAVTRGVDPNVKLKPSGIEWLGDVPSHWEVLALKRVLRRLIDCEHKTAPKVDQSAFLVARTSSVRNAMFRREGAYPTTAEAFAQWTRRGVPEVGDIIFTREAPAGEACMVPDDVQVCLGQRTVLLKVNKARCVPDWLLHMIYAGPPRLRIQLASQGSTVGHFNVDDIGWMQLLLPPATEQSRICAYLDTATAPIRTEIGRLRDSIERLQELRTRLFADVVTGKLDVRAAAAGLPDEPEEAFEDVEQQIEDIDDADTDVTEAAEVEE